VNIKPPSGKAALALARAATEKKVPYFMAGVYGLTPYPVPGLGTMGVSKGLALIYDPVWTMNLPTEECSNTIIHEVIHVYLDHCKRIEIAKMEPHMANIAADLSANGLMEEMELKLPHGYYPKDFGLPNGKTIEWYYYHVTKNPDNNKKIKQLQKDCQGDADDSEGGSGSGGGTGSPGEDGSEEGKGSGSSPSSSAGNAGNAGKKPRGRVGAGRCGGIAGNPIDKELEDRIDKELAKEIPQPPEARTRMIQRAVEAAIEQHVTKYGRGSMPTSLQEKINRTNEAPHVRWQDKLRYIARSMTGRMESGGMDFSYALPAKSSYVRGIPRPGMVQTQPEIAFIIDTSGSMCSKQISDSIREVVGVMKSTGVDEAWFLEADAAVAAKPKRVRLRSFANDLEIHGRGGTNFDPALQELMKLRPRPDIAFYMTDGDGSVTYKPPISVVWVVVNSYCNRKPAEWGHTIFVDGDSDGTNK
jgi:predicted metal-dependent peptidase